MASSLGDFPHHYLRNQILRGSVTIILGLALTWTLMAASFRMEAVRAHYDGMTSFTPLATIFIVLFSPLWIVIHLVVLRYLSGPTRFLVGLIIPTIIIIALSHAGIWTIYTAWMAGPD